MADPTNLPNLEERFQRVRAQMGALAGGGGHGPTDGGTTDHRIIVLEKSVEKIHGKLDKLIEAVREERLGAEQRFGSSAERLTAIEGKLDRTPPLSTWRELPGAWRRLRPLGRWSRSSWERSLPSSAARS